MASIERTRWDNRTVALLLVSGGIFVHYVDFLHDFLHGVPMIIKEFLTGLVAGFIVLGIIKLSKAIWTKIKKNKVVTNQTS